MALRRRKSKTLDDADMRANNITSIDDNLDLGNGVTLAEFKKLIADARDTLDDYNQTLALADTKANNVTTLEKGVRQYSVRIFSGVKSKFGPNSNQYEQAGGTREDERKKPARKGKKQG